MKSAVHLSATTTAVRRQRPYSPPPTTTIITTSTSTTDKAIITSSTVKTTLPPSLPPIATSSTTTKTSQLNSSTSPGSPRAYTRRSCYHHHFDHNKYTTRSPDYNLHYPTATITKPSVSLTLVVTSNQISTKHCPLSRQMWQTGYVADRRPELRNQGVTYMYDEERRGRRKRGSAWAAPMLACIAPIRSKSRSTAEPGRERRDEEVDLFDILEERPDLVTII